MGLLAYLDPGSGSILLQALLGGIAGGLVALKLFGRRVFRVLTFWKRRREEPRATSSPRPEPDRGGG